MFEFILLFFHFLDAVASPVLGHRFTHQNSSPLIIRLMNATFLLVDIILIAKEHSSRRFCIVPVSASNRHLALLTNRLEDLLGADLCAEEPGPKPH